MREFTADDLRITTSHTRVNVRVDWHGQSRIRNPDDKLVPFLMEIVDGASVSKMPLDIHFEQMAYCNSATITTIMRFVKAARDHDVELSVSFNGQRKWQQVLAESLTMFTSRDSRLRVHRVL